MPTTTRRTFFTGLAGLAAIARAQPAQRPNFIFLLADDLGWGDLPCYGQQKVVAHGGWLIRGDLKTPNLDRLAREGTRFTQFYVSSAVCSPSRTGFMTGRFPSRLGIHDYLARPEQNRKHGVTAAVDPKTPTVTSLLRESGYATGHFGKWHLSTGNQPRPEEYGIDLYRGCLDAGRARSSERIADEVIRFATANRNRPFYINAWLYDPHSPLHPSEESMAPYKQQLSPRWADHKGAFEVYYGVLTEMDRHIGRILDQLDQAGLGGNTIVVFSSDNGPETGLIPFTSHYGIAPSAGPFRGLKRSLYEGGIRTPFIVRALGRFPANRVDDVTVIGGTDFLPTIARLAGGNAPAGIDGEDLSAAFAGNPAARTKPLMWENRFPVYGHVLDQSPMLAIRSGKWKLLMNPDRSRTELYDVPADPSEMTNLASAQPAIVKRLSGELLAWQQTLPKGYVDPMAGRSTYPWPKPMQ
jgi:N-acetylgalactosamine-6-sulfatase